MGILDVAKRIGSGAIRMVSSVGNKAASYVAPTREERYQQSMKQYVRTNSHDTEEGARYKQEMMRIRNAQMKAQMRRQVERDMGVRTGRNGRPLQVQTTESGLLYRKTLQEKGTPFALSQGVKRRSSGRYRVGRPRGASGRYVIPGVGAVGVYQYRDWMKRQRQLDRQRMEEQMMNPQQRLQQAQNYPSYQEQQMQPQRYIPRQQSPQTMPQEPISSPVGKLNLWDPNISMVGEMNLWDNSFGQGDTGVGLFRKFGDGIL